MPSAVGSGNAVISGIDNVLFSTEIKLVQFVGD